MSIKDFTKRSWFGLLTRVFFSLYLDFHKRYTSKLKCHSFFFRGNVLLLFDIEM